MNENLGNGERWEEHVVCTCLYSVLSADLDLFSLFSSSPNSAPWTSAKAPPNLILNLTMLPTLARTPYSSGIQCC